MYTNTCLNMQTWLMNNIERKLTLIFVTMYTTDMLHVVESMHVLIDSKSSCYLIDDSRVLLVALIQPEPKVKACLIPNAFIAFH